MLPDKDKTVFFLSALVTILAAVASGGGFFYNELYRDNLLIKAAWQGNDLVTLAVAVPVMAVSSWLALQGNQRARLLWLGGLGYMLYNYIFYLYGAAFNRFFLIYAGLVFLSMYALILALIHTDARAISRHFHSRALQKRISGFMLFFAIPWSALEIARALSFVFTGQIPADVVVTGHPTAVVYATDLSLLMPAMVVSAILLWKAQPWGYVLSALILFKGTAYGLALVAMSAFAAGATGKGDPLAPLYVFLCTGSLICLILLLRRVKGKGRRLPDMQPAYPSFSKNA